MPTTTLEPRPVTTAGHRWATTAIVGAVTFVVRLALLHIIKPELDPTWRFVSEYALGTGGFLMTAEFLALAVACVSVVGMLWNQARTVVGRIGG